MKKIFYLFLFILSIPVLHSCLDLEERPYDRLSANIYYENERSVKGVVARLYHSQMYSFTETFYFLQEFSADQVAWHSWNGGTYGWDEGSKYVLSTQTWNPDSKYIADAWAKGWETIGLCNNAIYDFKKLNPSDLMMTQQKLNEYIAEVETMRAWAYYQIFEIWGGAIPLNTEPSDIIPGSVDADFNTGCKKIYEFISSELDKSVNDLPKNSVNRMNQATNRVLKARLLLNAELFANTPQYTECALICQDIIDGKYGTYSLASDYRKIYDAENINCTENIFALAQDPTHLNAGWMRRCPFYSTSLKSYFNPVQWGSVWNATILSPSFDNSADINLNQTPVCFLDAPYNDKLGAVYERFLNKDIRKKNYVYNISDNSFSGAFLKGAMKADFGNGVNLTADADRPGEQLVYVDQCGTFKGKGRSLETVMSPRWGETNSGIRLVKYPIYPASSGRDYREADEVEFRLSEVYFMLAECKLRTSNDVVATKNLVNEVRKRYFTTTDWATAQNELGRGFSDVNLDWLLSQWGLEFLNEGRRRRTDLRRFDKFTQGQWWFFGRATDDAVSLPAKRDRKYEWFPLPENAFLSNPKLIQNPAYNN